jgi:hypothetical protein
MDAKYEIAVTAADEVQFKTPDGTRTQKRISRKIHSDTALYYDTYWMREIAAYMSGLAYLHALFPKPMLHLQWVLYHSEEPASHAAVADELLTILEMWITSCQSDQSCLAPPSRDMLNDPEFRKVFNFFAESDPTLITRT